MNFQLLMYALLAVLVISLSSFVGVFFLGVKNEKLQKILIYLVAFSAGALLGDVFFHLIPELAEEGTNDWHQIGILILGGIVLGLLIEKVIHRNHCHHTISKEHPHSLAVMNLVGDFVHNFIDGLIIGASFLVSIPAGISTALAVLFHEIPQEIGDFAVLVHGGYEKKKALVMNFLTALSAVLGVVATFLLGTLVEGLHTMLVPIAIGMFIYIAGSDLIPEVNKHNQKLSSSLFQIGMVVLGAGVMFLLLFLEHHHH